MKKSKSDYLQLILIMLAVYAVICAFTGLWLIRTDNYNSYYIQAQAWLNGHLDLGQNYNWLEIAEYGGKYFISFPPFPTYLMLPFVLVFKGLFRGGMLAFASYILSGIFCYKLAKHFKSEAKDCIFIALFATVCSNYLFIGINDWVWFIAQNLCFCLTVASVYCAVCGRGAVCFALWACAVGCRPFTVCYLPFLILLCYDNYKQKNVPFAVSLLKWAVIPVIIGGSYMVINYMRFDNPFEFGHNYLPEFQEAPNGQFSVAYMKQNLYNLIRLPEISNGKLVFPEFNGVNMFIASPIFIYALIMFVMGFIKRDKITIVAFFCMLAELLCIVCHKTMGGSHLGNRYTVDVIPFAVYVISVHRTEKILYCIPLAVIGFGLNLVWIVQYFG